MQEIKYLERRNARAEIDVSDIENYESANKSSQTAQKAQTQRGVSLTAKIALVTILIGTLASIVYMFGIRQQHTMLELALSENLNVRYLEGNKIAESSYFKNT
jgi:hypothetical protein